MFKKALQSEAADERSLPREGDLYKAVTVCGKTFRLYYGYYEEIDRQSEPDVIYPNFVRNPEYTEEGRPFATVMQDPCRFFKGKRGEDACCGDCAYFRRCEDLLGICLCDTNRKRE